jgi:DNA-binding NarL/FixJ family response regulator
MFGSILVSVGNTYGITLVWTITILRPVHRLPVYHKEAKPHTQGHLKDLQEETMITLLLVDDEPLVRYGLRTWLEREADITVVGEANDGTEAIKLAQALQPDVVLMDIALPTMDGITAAAALRAAVPHSAVVFLSLYDDAATRARADAAGAVAFVGKQEGVRALRSAIRKAGRQGRAS